MTSPSSLAARAALGALLALSLASAARVQAQPFTYELVRQSMEAYSFGVSAWADADADGDYDVVVGGNAGPLAAPELGLWYYEQVARRTLRSGDTLVVREADYAGDALPGAALWLAASGWVDLEGDGDADLAVTGTASPDGPYVPTLRVYRNDGDGAFAATDPGIPGVYGGALTWGDFDNDGDADLVLLGARSDDDYRTRLYRNDGDGGFAEVDAGLPNVAFGDVGASDVDNDGDLDLALLGRTPTGTYVSGVYRNDGDGRFAPAQALPGLAYGALAWGDYDADGDDDLAISGGVLGPFLLEGRTIVYRNDGGAFVATSAPTVGVIFGTLAWGDYDLDGDLDLFETGGTSALERRYVGRVYRNSRGTFDHALNLPGIFPSRLTLGDADADGDLDVLLSGFTPTRGELLNYYQNTQRLVNTAPSAPGGLRASLDGAAATLRWDAADDVETDAAGLTYNLRVGTTPGGADVLAPLAMADGRRLVTAAGNAGHNRAWTLRGLPEGTYYWSVQALDNSYVGSAFADEGTFTLGATKGDGASGGAGTPDDVPTRFAVAGAYPNPFRDGTTLLVDVPRTASVRLAVYDVLGQRVQTLYDGPQEAGRREVRWDGRDAAGRPVSAGLYLVRLTADGRSWSQTLLRVR